MKCDKIYIAIDLKSFYASVECKERNRETRSKVSSSETAYLGISGHMLLRLLVFQLSLCGL